MNLKCSLKRDGQLVPVEWTFSAYWNFGLIGMAEKKGFQKEEIENLLSGPSHLADPVLEGFFSEYDFTYQNDYQFHIGDQEYEIMSGDVFSHCVGGYKCQ